MKNLFYLALVIGGLFVSNNSNAQVRVNINIGSQPLWGPVGYDYVRYYYMPEVDVYYNVASRKYTYFHGNRWVTKSKLPKQYRNFDIYRTHKVVINDNNPWKNHSRNRNQYGRYDRNHHQVVLRDGRNNRRSPAVDYRGPSKKHKESKNSHKRHDRDDRRR